MPHIVGGTAKGRMIKLPPGDVRPATSRVKQSLFDYLSGIIPESRVLDLYCGSGGLGLEAISRGAASVMFVDISARVLRVTRENAAKLGFVNQCEFLQKDVFKFLNNVIENPVGQFDIVLAAPPYKIAEPQRILDCISDAGILSPKASVCMEYNRHTPQPETEIFILDRRRNYGETVVDVWDTVI